MSILVASAVAAQSPGSPGASGSPIAPSQVTLPLANPPLPVTSASAQLVGNPGPNTLYFWVVANFIIGNAAPAGPFVLMQSPITLNSSNYVQLSWQPIAGAISYDILLTSTAAAPSGSCNCALAVGQASTTYNAQSNSTVAYTVTTLNPNAFAITVQNVQLSNGVSRVTWSLPNGTVLGTMDSNGNATWNQYPFINVMAPPYGAVNDGAQLYSGCSQTSGSFIVACPSGTFTSTAVDAGKTIVVPTAGAATGCSASNASGVCPLKTKIASVSDSAHATVLASAVSSVSNVGLLFGTDNRAAIQAAVDLLASPQTSEYAIYIPHAAGQGTSVSTKAPGCYLVDGTINLPNSGSNEYKWLKIYGDGNDSSELCEADVTHDLFLFQYPSGAVGTELWIDGIGMFGGTPGYYSTAALHCERCPAARITNSWLDNWQAAVLMDPTGGNPANAGSQLLKMFGNTCEFSYECVRWNNGVGNSQLLASGNVFDSDAFNFALSGTAYTIDLTNVADVDINHNHFLYWVGRGIRCNSCTGFNIISNDFSTDTTSYDGIYNQLLVGGVANGTIADNHFSTANDTAVYVFGNNSGLSWRGNTFSPSAPQAYMVWSAVGGANTGITVQEEKILGCASPCITIPVASLAATKVSRNYFVSSITTPVSVTGGAVPDGSCVALSSQDDCLLSYHFSTLPAGWAGQVVWCTDCNAGCTAGSSNGATCSKNSAGWVH